MSRPARRLVRLLFTVALVAALVAPVGVAGAAPPGPSPVASHVAPGGPGPESNAKAPEALRDGALRVLVADASNAGSRAGDDRVRVEVVPATSEEQARDAVNEVGGTVVGEGFGRFVARVAIDRLVDLEQHPDVARVSAEPHFPRPEGPAVDPEASDDEGTRKAGTTLGDHVAFVNLDHWHAAGHQGQGVKIGIIDGFDGATWDSAMATGDLPAPTATFCRFGGASCNWRAGGSTHGNGVAEIIHDAAPRANLYLVDVSTPQDLIDGVEWLIGQGVHIISRSVITVYDGPGDGTGLEAAIVDYAVANGIAWFNAAGNEAGAYSGDGAYYRRTGFNTVVASDGKRYVVFPETNDIYLPTTSGRGCGGFHGVRWTDFGSATPTDLDVLLYDTGGTLRYLGEDYQRNASEPPIEVPDAVNGGCQNSNTHHLYVRVHDAGDDFDGATGVLNDRLEIMFFRTRIAGSSNPYSATGPAVDSANPGMMAVGAIDPPEGYEIADYSSQGPTNATAGRPSRLKPEISAVTNLSVSFGTFNGTSGATPVVSGTAAVLRSAGLASTPAQLTEALKARARDRGTAGADNVFGYGELILEKTPPNSGSGGPADLRLTVKATPATIDPVDPGVFAVTVKNEGGSAATDVRVDVNHSFSLGSPTVKGPDGACPQETGNSVIGAPSTVYVCRLGTLAAGKSTTISVRGSVDGDTASVDGFASTTSEESDHDDNRAVATVTVQRGLPGIFRLAGADRFATAAEIALDRWAGQRPKVVYLATGLGFPDALAGTPLAASTKGPILLATSTELPAATAKALGTLDPTQVVALGGTAVLSDDVLAAAGRAAGGAGTDRIGGRDRYDTAAQIADALPGTPDVVYLALGTNFPDALAAGPAAAPAPILLTDPGVLPEATVAALRALKPDKVVALGGRGVLSNELLFAAQAAAGAAAVGRYAGPDRYATAVAIASESFSLPSTVYVAVGGNFPDALGGGPPAVREGAPLLLVEKDVIPAPLQAYLQSLKDEGVLDRLVVLGGEGVISDAVKGLLEQYLVDPAPPPPGA